ncbi:MAG TPA: sugar phosphate nucleotidyltransferase, partial [Bryobacteraceae bacterium]|nr:sugar phosphate nucleotidyltransferase [Bryobacteraceae bacterium]
ESFAGEEPFLVALGDSILGLNAVSRAVSRMAEVYESRRASCVIAVEEVPREETRHYGIVQPEENGDVFRIVNLVEKPRPENAPSNLAIAGRYIFSPVIFDMIRRVQPDSRGEIQLTNAIQLLCEQGRRVIGVKLARGEKRYDIGNFPSYFESFVEFALADPVYGEEFRRALERLLAQSTAAAAKA